MAGRAKSRAAREEEPVLGSSEASKGATSQRVRASVVQAVGFIRVLGLEV